MQVDMGVALGPEMEDRSCSKMFHDEAARNVQMIMKGCS